MLIDRARSGSVSDLMIGVMDDESHIGGICMELEAKMIEEDTLCRTTVWFGEVINSCTACAGHF